ncbi:hypothetical protein ABPG72_021659 [Tetrahymena utriculariae]
MKLLFISLFLFAFVLSETDQQQQQKQPAIENEEKELVEKLKNNEILYIQQICMTFSESQCKQFNYDQYLTRSNLTQRAEQLNEMAQRLKHINPAFEFRVFDNSSISLVPKKNLSDNNFIFRSNKQNSLTNIFNPKTFYNYKDMKNNFKEFKNILNKFEHEREVQLVLNLLLHIENINNSIFSLYLPHIPSTMNVPILTFGLTEMQVLASIDKNILHKFMEKRMEIQQLWYKFKNLTSNYTEKQMKEIFGFKEERLVDFADFSWALLHIYKYSIDYEGVFYIIPGFEFVRQTNNFLKKIYFQTEANSDLSVFIPGYQKGRPLVYNYNKDPEHYFIFNREINHNHPKECVQLKIINENEISQCMEDILFYANIKKGNLCVRKDKEFQYQIDVFIQVINLKRSFSCKCRDDIREVIYNNPDINLIDSIDIIKEKCLQGKHNDPKYYQKDIRPQFQPVLEAQKQEYDSFLQKLSNEEFILKNLQGIYVDNLELMYNLVNYKKKALQILERAIKRAYAALDQHKLSENQSKREEKNKKQEANVVHDIEKEDL